MATGGRDTGEGSGSKKGKAKMSPAAWAKLSKKEKDIDYGGSRFMRVGSSSKAKEAGHRDSGNPSRAGGRASGRGR